VKAHSEPGTTRGLALALPIESGQRVLIVGEEHRALGTSLRRTGSVPHLLAPSGDVDGFPAKLAATAVDDPRRWPDHLGTFEHAIVASTTSGWSTAAASALPTCLSDTGQALVAGPARAGTADPELRRAVDRLTEQRYEVIGEYGIRQHLHDVRHLVPLAGPGLYWYGRDAYLAFSRRSNRLMHAAATLRLGPIARRTFGAVGFVLARSPSGDPC
jgi:hypothetical protein